MPNMPDRRARARDLTGRTPGPEVQTSRKRSPLTAVDRSDLKHRPVDLGLGGAVRRPRAEARAARRKARHNTKRGRAGGQALFNRGRKRVIERASHTPGPPNA